MPTLYDNFERVRQYIDQQTGVDLSAYVTYAYLASKNYLDSVPSDYPTYTAISGMSYITMTDVSACGYLTSVPSEYITQDELSANGYISSIPSEYITQDELSAMSYATQSYVSDAISQIPGVDLSAYVSKVELSACGYLTSIPSEYITESELSACGYLTSIPSEYITQDELSANGYISSIPSEYITQDELSDMSYATQSYVSDAISQIPGVDLSAYVSKVELSECGYLTSVPSEYITQDELSANAYLTSIPSEYITDSELSAMSYASKSYVVDYVSTYAPTPDLSAYVTKTELNNASYVSQSSLSSNSYATTSQLSGYLPLSGGTVTGDIVPSYYDPDNDDWVNLGSSSYKFGIYASQIEADGVGAEAISTNELYTDWIGGNSEDCVGEFGIVYLGGNDITTVFPTYAAISAMSYATTSQLPVIDENLIPKTNNTYSLGSDNKRYKNAYISGNLNATTTYTDSQYTWGLYGWTDLTIGLIEEGNIIFEPIDGGVYTPSITPKENNTYSLGSNSLKWAYTYTNNLILNGTDINDKFLPLSGGTLSGNLFAGDQEKTTVTFLATRRKCGGDNGTSYMASFFTNSDGRSKFAHKSYTGTKADVSNDVDDAFICFNAYGFKLAYSGTQGVAASTEYDILHTGNIGNLGYATTTQLNTVNSTGKVHIGTASTTSTSANAVCTVTVDTFELDSNNKPLVGTNIAFKVTSATSVNGAAMKLNVNGTGNISMWYDQTENTSTTRNWYRDCTRVNAWYYFIYDGTYWVWQGINSENNSTYSQMTDANMGGGTDTNARLVSAKQLATYYTPKSAFVYDSTTYTLTITV